MLRCDYRRCAARSAWDLGPGATWILGACGETEVGNRGNQAEGTTGETVDFQLGRHLATSSATPFGNFCGHGLCGGWGVMGRAFGPSWDAGDECRMWRCDPSSGVGLVMVRAFSPWRCGSGGCPGALPRAGMVRAFGPWRGGTKPSTANQPGVGPAPSPVVMRVGGGGGGWVSRSGPWCGLCSRDAGRRGRWRSQGVGLRGLGWVGWWIEYE